MGIVVPAGRPLQAARPAGELLCRRGRTPDDGRDLVEGTANMSSIGHIPSSRRVITLTDETQPM